MLLYKLLLPVQFIITAVGAYSINEDPALFDKNINVCPASPLCDYCDRDYTFDDDSWKFFRKLRKVTRSKTACAVCKSSLQVFKQVTRRDTGLVYKLLEKICFHKRKLRRMALFNQLCENLDHYSPNAAENDKFSFLPDFINVLQHMNPMGIEGQYLCHYIFSKSCPLPETPQFDYDSLWPEKPSDIPSPMPVKDPKSKKKHPKNRKRNTFKVLHVSDIHLSLKYSENTPANCLDVMCCRPGSFHNPMLPYVAAPKYGYWKCDAPPQLLESASESFAGKKYAFALFTGDMVDHNPVLVTRKETQLEEKETMDAFKRWLPNTPVFPVLGNHDSFPYSQEPSASSQFYDRTEDNINFLGDLWMRYNWIGQHSAMQLRRTHGGYAVEPMEGLKVISLNSNYWYRWNFYNYLDIHNPIRSDIFQFLIKELLDCERRGIKAWIQAHVPPGGLPDEALPPQATLLVATFERFSDVIKGYFFGHTHHDEFTVLYSRNASVRCEDDAIGVVNVGPSITPFTDLNPGWRYYEVDSETFEIMDIVTYYADIEPGFDQTWSETPNLKWQKLYSARSQYANLVSWPKSEPLNGKFWHRLAFKFLGSYDLTNDYLRKSYRNSSKAPVCSDSICLARVYCYSTSMTPDQAVSCINEYFIHSKTLSGVPKFPMPKPIRYQPTARV